MINLFTRDLVLYVHYTERECKTYVKLSVKVLEFLAELFNQREQNLSKSI